MLTFPSESHIKYIISLIYVNHYEQKDIYDLYMTFQQVICGKLPGFDSKGLSRDRSASLSMTVI